VPTPRPNWFFAFPLDGSFIARLPPPPASIRLFHPDDVHLTLSFLGSCGSDAAERALAALDAELAVQSAPSIDVSLSAVVPMGPQPEYSALSALLERGRAPTEQLMLRLRDCVSEAALGRRETRPPKPHVTIARPARRAREAARQAGLTWAASLDLSAQSAKLDRIALYTWSAGSGAERLFRIVAERQLGRIDSPQFAP
jgi:RNA 2',3'-cyclic 3'-phosphodiesterase